MKITTFNPLIITKDAEPITKLFGELGFEVRHNPGGFGELNVDAIRMKDENSFYLDISMPDIELPQDMTVIRMNVDDFDEAFKLLTEHGFKNFYGDKTMGTETATSTLMISPSGFAIMLIQHIKDHN